MLILIIIISALAVIPIFGVLNFTIRRKLTSKICLPWFNPDNIADINGISTHVLIKGEGEPLLFVHGSQMNLYDWRYNIDFFSRYFKVYAFDMVGCGFSDKPKADYSPAYFAEFIKGFMDRYNIEKASFVGSSWGGGHVFHFALKYPQRVNKLVLSSPCGLPHRMTGVFSLLGIPIISNLMMLYTSKSLLRMTAYDTMYRKEPVDPAFIDSIYVPVLMKGFINATVKSYRNADFSFVQENLEKVSSPVLLIWGTRDPEHGKWMMDEMVARIADCRMIVIDNVGHLPHEESSEEFNDQSLKFLLA